ncbi:hypothetical protein AWB66_00607 [Caballeronia telluris]|uniref:Uncharacterized protein n=1 Tax=Caballeronia telluris TaxID=326475 RepID=A0A158F7F9_9BURK|nr:hypothetical protein AWB66_00607 [Caballeronia telluris]
MTQRAVLVARVIPRRILRQARSRQVAYRRDAGETRHRLGDRRLRKRQARQASVVRQRAHGQMAVQQHTALVILRRAIRPRPPLPRQRDPQLPAHHAVAHRGMKVPLRFLVARRPAAMPEARERVVGVPGAAVRIGGGHRQHVVGLDVIREDGLHAHAVLLVMPVGGLHRLRIDFEQIDHGRAEQAKALLSHRLVAGHAGIQFDFEGHPRFPRRHRRAIEAAQIDEVKLLREHEILQQRLLAIELLVALRVRDGPQPCRRTEPRRLEVHPRQRLQRAVVYRWQAQPDRGHLARERRIQRGSRGPVTMQIQANARQVRVIALFPEPEAQGKADDGAPVRAYRQRGVLDRQRQQFDRLRGAKRALHSVGSDRRRAHHGPGRNLRRGRTLAAQGRAFDNRQRRNRPRHVFIEVVEQSLGEFRHRVVELHALGRHEERKGFVDRPDLLVLLAIKHAETACGVGLVAGELAARLTQVAHLGVEISQERIPAFLLERFPRRSHGCNSGGNGGREGDPDITPARPVTKMRSGIRKPRSFSKSSGPAPACTRSR